MFTPDKNGEYDNVVGSRQSLEALNARGGNPVGYALGRFANRISNGGFSIDGIRYEITRNMGQHTLHGGNKTFANIVWDVESVAGNSVIMSCILEDGSDGFPGNMKTYLTFSITDDDALSISFKATTDKPTVCNLSHHVYFNLEGFHGGDILDHTLQIKADKILEVGASLIPTGKFISVKNSPFDFRKAVRIGDRQQKGGVTPGSPDIIVKDTKLSYLDHNFCLKHKSASRIESVAVLYSPKSGRRMEVLNNHPGLQIYTGMSSAIALESQMYPDSPNRPEFPSTVLRPGDTYNHTVIYRFSVR